MKKHIIIIGLLIFAFSNSMFAVEVPGLDSVDLGNRIEALRIEESTYTGELDTSMIYFLRMENEENKRPDYLIRYGKDADGYIHVFADSQRNYIFEDKVYYQFETRFFKYISPLLILYGMQELSEAVVFDFAYQRRIPFNTYMEFDTNSHTATFRAEYDSVVNNNFTKCKINWNYKDYNYIEYKDMKVIGMDTIPDLNDHLIYRRAEGNEVFDEMEHFFENERNNYAYSEPKKREKKKRVKVGDKINFDYELPGANREDLDVEKLYSKSDYIFMYNWGAWCAPCIANKKTIEEFHKKYSDKVNFITIDCEHDRATFDEIKLYVEKQNIDYPVYVNCKFLEENNIESYPNMLLIDKNQEVVEIVGGGPQELEAYEKLIEKYIE